MSIFIVLFKLYGHERKTIFCWSNWFALGCGVYTTTTTTTTTKPKQQHTKNVFKKDKRRRIKKGKKELVHKSYTDYGKLVKDQWTAILANFVRK